MALHIICIIGIVDFVASGFVTFLQSGEGDPFKTGRGIIVILLFATLSTVTAWEEGRINAKKQLAKEVAIKRISSQGENSSTAQIKITLDKDGELKDVVLIPGTTKPDVIGK